MKNLLCILLILLAFNSCRHKTTKIVESRDVIKNNLKDLSIANQDSLLIVSDENDVFEACFSDLDEKPIFRNGDDDVRKYLIENLKYPESAIDSNIQGRVFVRFVVMKNGSVGEIKILRGVCKSIDSICTSVFENMPKWKSGIFNGKNVNVQYIIPITFKIEDENESKNLEQNSKKGINENLGIKLYPNPASDYFKFSISIQFSEATYQIVNLSGQVVKSGSIHSENEQINVHELNNGMYIVKVVSKEINLNATEKLIIKK